MASRNKPALCCANCAENGAVQDQEPLGCSLLWDNPEHCEYVLVHNKAVWPIARLDKVRQDSQTEDSDEERQSWSTHQ